MKELAFSDLKYTNKVDMLYRISWIILFFVFKYWICARWEIWSKSVQTSDYMNAYGKFNTELVLCY